MLSYLQANSTNKLQAVMGPVYITRLIEIRACLFLTDARDGGLKNEAEMVHV